MRIDSLADDALHGDAISGHLTHDVGDHPHGRGDNESPALLITGLRRFPATPGKPAAGCNYPRQSNH